MVLITEISKNGNILIALTDATLRIFFGESVYNTIDNRNVFTPLSEAVLKTKADNMDTRSVIVYAANAFESFLDGYAHSKGVSLIGKNGIIQKKDALSQSLSKKHRGMIDYIGQVRNAADHGGDVDENGQMWNVSYSILYIPSVIFEMYSLSYTVPVYLLTDGVGRISEDVCDPSLHTTKLNVRPSSLSSHFSIFLCFY